MQSTPSLWSRTLRTVVSWPVLVTVVFAAGASLIALYGDVSLPYSIGQRIDQPVSARVSFSVPDPAATAANKENARALTPSHYILNSAHLSRIEHELTSFHRAVLEAESYETFVAQTQEDWALDEQSFTALRALGGVDRPGGFEAAVKKLGERLRHEYIAEDLAKEPRTPASRAEVIVVHQEGEPGAAPDSQAGRLCHRGEVTSIDSDLQLEGRASSLALGFPPGTREPVHKLLRALLGKTPTIRFSTELTLADIQRNAEAVPQARIAFDQGQYILTPRLGAEDSGLKPSEYELLEAEQQAYLAFLKSGTVDAEAALRRERLQSAGIVTLVAFLSIGLFVYVAHHQRRILENHTRTVAFVVLVLATLAAAALVGGKWSADVPELVLGPCLFAGSVMAIVYPRRFAVGAMCMVGMVVALTLRWNLVFALTLLTGVAVNGFQLHDIRSRPKIITAGIIAGIAVALASFAGWMVSQEGPQFALRHAMWALASATGAAFVVSGALPFIEKAFGIATPLTLLEWSESRCPLLQLLANEAPGTHQHSLAVSRLVDAACRVIGADGQLASVGALYHDIGKIPKAEYFVENQQAPINRHENLAPTMSLLIIVAHVKDGVEMAREYKLPRVLLQFIEEHHGTTVVRYFHHVASEKQPAIASGKHDREVPEAEFRYTGPKPRTRESAVLMLSDGVEGAVRSLKEPTPGRIESVVHQIVMDRLNDGQFDDCDITLGEIHRAEESLVKTLCSLYHGRVAYPESKKTEGKKPEAEVGKAASAGGQEQKSAG